MNGYRCPSCKHAKPNPHADTGFECGIEKFTRCKPYTFGHLYERAPAIKPDPKADPKTVRDALMHRIADLSLAGRSQAEISVELGIAAKYVGVLLDRAVASMPERFPNGKPKAITPTSSLEHLQPEVLKLYAEGLSLAKVAACLGISRETVRRLVTKAGVEVRDGFAQAGPRSDGHQQAAKILDLRRQGASYGEIEKALGVTRLVVRDVLRRGYA